MTYFILSNQSSATLSNTKEKFAKCSRWAQRLPEERQNETHQCPHLVELSFQLSPIPEIPETQTSSNSTQQESFRRYTLSDQLSISTEHHVPDDSKIVHNSCYHTHIRKRKTATSSTTKS